MSHSIRRAVGVAAAAGIAVVGVQLIGTVAAYAHANTVSGIAACQQDGTYTVTWTVQNTYTSEDETATVTAHAPDASSLSATSFDIPSNGSHQLTQSGVPASAGTATIDVGGLWHPDNFTQDPIQGSVRLDGSCGGTVPTSPAAANGACVNYVITTPSVTVPRQTGVSFTLDHRVASAGRHTVTAGTHTVSASSSTLRLTGRQSWTFHVSTFTGHCSAPETSTKPVTPTVTQSVCTGTGPSTPTLTTHSTRGITYRVTPSGPYRTGETVTVVATAKSGYVLGQVPSTWTKTSAHSATYRTTFHQAPTCSDTAGSVEHNTPVSTSSSGSGGLANTGPRTGVMLATAAGLLALGTLFLFGGRRRRTE